MTGVSCFLNESTDLECTPGNGNEFQNMKKCDTLLFYMKVKVELYTSGTCRAWFTFRGRGTRTDWFSKDNFIDSNYGNELARRAFNFFAISG